MSHSTDLSVPQTAGFVNTEVNVTPRRKRYTAAFKARIMQEATRCNVSGELGAMLRREGIFFSTLTDFRKQKARDDHKDKRNPTLPREEFSPHFLKELAASEREVGRTYSVRLKKDWRSSHVNRYDDTDPTKKGIARWEAKS